MIEHHRTPAAAVACLVAVTAALTAAGPAAADPPDPTPVPEYPAVVPAGDTPPPPPARDPFAPYVPEIQNPTYGSGNSGGGVFGTLKDLWQQVQNPMFAPNEIMGAGGAARGVAAPLLEAGPARLVIANRTPASAAALAEAFGQHGVPVAASTFADLDGPFDLIVNATSASLSAALPPLPASPCSLSPPPPPTTSAARSRPSSPPRCPTAPTAATSSSTGRGPSCSG